MIARSAFCQDDVSDQGLIPGHAPRPKLDDSWQLRFLRLLPAIRRYARIRYRAVPSELRAEMIQDTIACALLDYL